MSLEKRISYLKQIANEVEETIYKIVIECFESDKPYPYNEIKRILKKYKIVYNKLWIKKYISITNNLLCKINPEREKMFERLDFFSPTRVLERGHQRVVNYFVLSETKYIPTNDQSLISDMFSSGEIGLEELKLKDVSFTYDSSIWPYKASTTNNTSSVGVSKSNCLVGLMYSKNDYYITTEAFAKQHKDGYINQGYKIVEDLEKITINGNEWFKLVVNEPNSTALQLFFVKGYDAYSFTYKAVSSDYYANLQYAQEVYNTLKYDNSSDLASQQNGKRQLIGEWDWDRSGYVVADSDRIYVYRDSSKDPQNVYYGTYVVYDRIMTYGEGYIEGLYLMINVERSIINGQVSDEKYQLEFALIPNNDGTYTLKKIGYDAQVIVRKVK